MKKAILTLRKNLTGLVLCSIFIVNCSDDGPYHDDASKLALEKSELHSLSVSEKYAYVTKHLNVLRNGFLTITGNDGYRRILYDEIEMKFDGDFDVLIETLHSRIPKLMNELSHSPFITNGNYEVSMTAFSNIVDSVVVNLFPQVHIPNYLQLKEKGIIGNGVVTVVGYNGDETPIEWEGIKNNESKLEVVIVDEKYCSENEVWVIGLNDGKVPYMNLEDYKSSANARIQIIDCLNSGEEPCSTSPALWSDIWTYKFSIDCLKENIFSGNADVAITTWTCFEDFINPITGQQEPVDWFGDPEYRDLLSLDNFYLHKCFGPIGVGGKAVQAIHTFPVVTGFSTPTTPNESGGVGDHLYYVIFEHDNWPAGLKFRNVDPFWNSTSLNISFRSSQSEYGYGVFSSAEECFVCAPGNGTTACDHLINNDCAEFSFYKQ